MSPVDSADVTGASVGHFPDDKPSKLCVAIKLDHITVQTTETVKQNETVSWNNLILLYV
jgi:hypothetical protein